MYAVKRSHRCGELSASAVGKSVQLIGWIRSRRDHGGLFFLDLGDSSGIVQLMVDERMHPELKKLSSVRCESVIEVAGVLQFRPEETANGKLATGAVEVLVESATVISESDAIPFPLDDAFAEKVNEETRLSYRYLDLRRPINQLRLRRRHNIAAATRNFLNENNFLEIELPTLFKTTPEGAREFLVPSRTNRGQFYALAQSPQQYKQMLMVAGIERYYSLARCYRDEDLRTDRQPEFTQIDMEMAFVGREDIHEIIEGLMGRIWKDVLGLELKTPLQRITFHEAMDRYGSDKPDRRFPMELVDVSAIFANSPFGIFASAVAGGGVVKAINGKGLASLSQGDMATLENGAKAMGAKGLAYAKVDGDRWKSPIGKFLDEGTRKQLRDSLGAEDGDLILFSAGPWERACIILGRVRLDCATLLGAGKNGGGPIANEPLDLFWVVDFPLLTFDDEQNRYVSTHHPFTAPMEEDVPLLESNPASVRGQHYDLVLNGVELGGGSIRIHSSDMQRYVFEELLKIQAESVENLFGYMVRAFRFGAPPHGGIAIGLDRLAAMLSGTNSIRDVIAFPKTAKGIDPMVQSPSPASERQLNELFIAIR
ncbi:MAG: aspartate--tRNA ligase [Puniceicoccales bacterium]|jgi:aspartyl-tRNA synthetase|nr:aspartate--tRNA ligase [Puniceicoccales bacterium]